MSREQKRSKLNLKTLEYENDNNQKKETQGPKRKKTLDLNVIWFVALIIILIIILTFSIYKKKSVKFVVNDFYKIAKEDLREAKNKYNERYDFNDKVNKILSSRLKYEIIETKELTTPTQKEEKTKVVEVKIKLSNIDKKKARAEAGKKTSNDLKVGSEKYNKEYLKNLKEAVKNEVLETKETSMRLKQVDGKWYITDTGSTDTI